MKLHYTHVGKIPILSLELLFFQAYYVSGTISDISDPI